MHVMLGALHAQHKAQIVPNVNQLWRRHLYVNAQVVIIKALVINVIRVKKVVSHVMFQAQIAPNVYHHWRQHPHVNAQEGIIKILHINANRVMLVV